MITQQVAAYLEQCFTMPVLPASIFLLLIVAYGSLVLLGALDFDLIDVDIDIDADADLDAVTSAGFVTLKFLNLADVPIMVWLCLYGLSWWGFSQLVWLTWDQNSVDPNTTLLLVRNIAASAIITKILTNPLAKLFAKPHVFRPEELIGRDCEITTYEVTEDFGQAKYSTEAAPLLLDVKMTEGKLLKGEVARIVDYDPETKTHYLEALSDPP